MERLMLMDAGNYAPGMEEICRVAVRGIIFLDGKLLLTEDSFGEVKLPGGGQEPGESDLETLLREVKEETGYSVLPESVREFGYIEEKRLSMKEDKIWHQFNRLYFCDVDRARGECDYSEGEKRRGFRQVFYTLEEALEKNRQMLGREGKQAWNQREYQTLLLIGKELESEKQQIK